MNLVSGMTPQRKEELVSIAKLRYERGIAWMRPKAEAWVRYYKIYRAMKDSSYDEDEPNTFLPYAYGVVMYAVSKVVEPLFKLRPPCRPKPKKVTDTAAAEKFQNVTRNYFSSSEYQLDFIGSTIERAITGSAWEKDEYLMEYREGLAWEQVPMMGMLKEPIKLLGKVVNLQRLAEFAYKGWQAVKKLYPVKVGYHCSFPSVFDVIPEPGPLKDKELTWVLEEIHEVPVAKLLAAKYRDPETGELRPTYHLDELLRDHDRDPKAPLKRKDGRGTIMPSYEGWGSGQNLGRQMRQEINLQPASSTEDYQADVDKVWVVQVWERDKMYEVANGKYIIRYVEFPLHYPRLPYRLRRWVIDKYSLWGIGLLEPVEDVLHEMNDVHNLTMSNWIRIVNKMMAVHMDAIPFPDDFKPRAGGKIRVKTNFPRVGDAIMPIDQSDPSSSMLLHSSNLRGMVEWADGVADLSPGKEGTKQTHDTLGGLLEISSNIANRVATVIRGDLACYQDQMDSMEKIYDQFQWEKVSTRTYADDGSTSMMEWDRADLYTEGRGFDYLNDIDPSWGDDSVQRNQILLMLRESVAYEEARRKWGDPEMKKIDITEIIQKLAFNLGWTDTSRLLKNPNGAMDPGKEFDLMLQGVDVQPVQGEDLTGHLIEHIMQRNSPRLAEAIEAGKADPKIKDRLDKHISDTLTMLRDIAADPVAAANARKVAMLGGAGGNA